MRRRHSLALTPFALGLALAAFAVADALAEEGVATIEAPHGDGPVPWTGLEPLEPPGEFRFLVVTDRTGEHRDGVFAGAMPKINLVRPSFVVSVGDLIEGYSDDPAVLGREWDEMEGWVEGLDMPFFYAAGNHDMSNAVMANEWKRRFGASTYHFVYEDVLFLVLNSELFGMVHDPRSPVPGPFEQAEQMALVERVLAENEDVRWTIVLVHQPLWDRPEIHPDWQRVETLLGARPYTVFAGHVHRYTSQKRGDRRFITLGTTGGGSGLRGTTWGEFDHVTQVTMTPDGPVIANLLLDGIQDADVRTEEMRTLLRGLESAVQVEPFLTDDGFESGTARLSVANPGPRPLAVRARYLAGRDLVPATTRGTLDLPPGEVGTLEIPVDARASLALAQVAPAVAEVTLGTVQADGEPFEIRLDFPILPERLFAATPAADPIVVDGRLDEWGALRFDVEEPAEVGGHGRHTGPEDASFRFDVRDGGDFVYVAVDVWDDSVVSSPDEIARHQDHVSLSVDARPEAERNANLGLFHEIRGGGFGRMVSPLVAVGPSRPDGIFSLFGVSAPEGLVTAAQPTDRGYAVEIAIPSALLDAAADASWERARINVTVNDFDAGEPDHTTLSWRPSRFEGRAAAGAGTFARGSTPGTASN